MTRINERTPRADLTLGQTSAPAVASKSKPIEQNRGDAKALERAIHANPSSTAATLPAVGAKRGTTAAALLRGACLEPDPSVERAAKIARSVLAARTSLDTIRKVTEHYPEMTWLTGNVDATPERGAASTGASYAQALFGVDAIEFERTSVGIDALLWTRRGDHQAFTACQPDAAKMTPETFARMQTTPSRFCAKQESSPGQPQGTPKPWVSTRSLRTQF